jgi:uncharacterized protein (DUF58 family)
MFKRRWLYAAGFLLLLGLLAKNETPVLLASLVLLTGGVSWLWNRCCLRGLEYERLLSERRVFPGEKVTLTLRVTNRKLLPLAWLKVEEKFPPELHPFSEKLPPSIRPFAGLIVHLLSMRWYERVSWRYELICDRRGLYFFGPATIRSGDPFGFFEGEAQAGGTDALIVYPRIVPLTELGFPARNPLGERKAQERIFEDPTRALGIRDYTPQDARKHIHWKATARRQRLQVKVYEPTSTPHLAIFLNLITLKPPLLGSNPDLFEQAITAAASIAHHALERRYSVGLWANGCLPGSDQYISLGPGRHPRQLTRILEALAMVTPFPLLPFEELLGRESSNLPWGTTLVIISAIVTEDLVGEMLRLKKGGHRLILVSSGDFAGPLPDIAVYRFRTP